MGRLFRLALLGALILDGGVRALAAAPAADRDTLGLWRLDEGQGVRAGDAAGTNHGQVVGATWTAGRSGPALRFDGKSHVDCGTAAALNPATALTVEAWFRLSSLDFAGRPWVNLVNKESYASGYCLLFYLGHLAGSISTAAGTFIVEVNTPGYLRPTYDLDWHHAAMTYDGHELTLFLDGNLVGRTAASGLLTPSQDNLWIGGMHWTQSRYFAGDIGAVRLSSVAREPADFLDLDAARRAVPTAVARGSIKTRKGLFGKGYLREDGSLLALGNGTVEFVFDRQRGGQLVGMTDTRAPGLALAAAGTRLAGQWEFDLEGSPAFGSATATFLAGAYASDRQGATLEIRSERSGDVRLTQTYALPGAGDYLICRGVLENLTGRPLYLKQYQFTLANLAIGGSLEGNRYAYPPHVFGFLQGDLREATAEFMGKRYIYGHLQETGKLMLPYAMIHHDRLGECIAIASVNPRTVARVGALGGVSGTLTGHFGLFKTLQPSQKEDLGTVYLALHRGDWQQGTLAEKALLMKEAGFRAPPTQPQDLADTVIMSDGIPGVNVSTFDDLGDLLPDYRAAGITTLHIGGMHFFCPSVLDPQKGVEGFIPVPLNGYATPNPQAGGREGLARLVARAHQQGMRLTVWGPFSMSGISVESAEATREPDWWVYDKDGNFSFWYPFIAPANPNSPGWRAFFLDNVRKLVTDYGVDGFWLDSSWLDHSLNYRAADGWYGGPNGAKASLMGEIVDLAKGLNPDVLVMAEGGGAAYMSKVDAAYTQAFGIWPGLSAEEMQTFVLAEELNRLPGVRPFGQICQGIGFFADLQGRPHEMAVKYKDSWMAKTLLVSTLDRVPIYFGLNWGIGYILHAGNLRFPPGTENNPERLEAERSQQEFAVWFESFKRINRIRAENAEIREGETSFGAFSVSSPSVVHYLRHRRGRSSLVLVNAEPQPQQVTVRVEQAALLGLRPGRHYRVDELMTGTRLARADGRSVWTGAELLGEGIGVALAGYGGAVLQIRPAAGD
jgi:hypothetical protein